MYLYKQLLVVVLYKQWDKIEKERERERMSNEIQFPLKLSFQSDLHTFKQNQDKRSQETYKPFKYLDSGKGNDMNAIQNRTSSSLYDKYSKGMGYCGGKQFPLSSVTNFRFHYKYTTHVERGRV